MSGYEGYADFSQAQPEGQKAAGGGGGDWSGYGGQSVSKTINNLTNRFAYILI